MKTFKPPSSYNTGVFFCLKQGTDSLRQKIIRCITGCYALFPTFIESGFWDNGEVLGKWFKVKINLYFRSLNLHKIFRKWEESANNNDSKQSDRVTMFML